ncbi:MAG TPA: malto-oligosyltrehalose trehalohydrolase [Cyclobacteriaceae bacterium]|nr:malto-oligosyltrehalose trehalohydrolase [Cyclobacteriaceae bacterium]
MNEKITQPVGARYGRGVCSFTVWAPLADKIQLLIKDQKQALDMTKDEWGYWHVETELAPKARYMFLVNGELKRPDPASLSQPDGVHEWSEVIDHHDYQWHDQAWKAPALEDMVIYELHVGTFTPEGTFEAVMDKLDHLLELGINAIEIMPIAQFAGSRNWGYDGVYPYAAQNSYGGVGKLKQLVDKCHQKNMAVILDVVYNHMGPEGNYLSDFGPYFTDKYHTPWGSALNFDDAYSGPVRSFFLHNALSWLRDFHIDGLRLDAVHAIMDNGPVHLLKELRMKVDELEAESGKKYCLIAESDMNDVKIISDYSVGGYGLDGQWVDDFHHAVHTLATGEREGYYEDYGAIHHLSKTFKQGFIYDGIYSGFRKKQVGKAPEGVHPGQLVICLQNHDQIGNRMMGDRISQLVSFEMLKLAAGTMLISPYVPMLFMGEEYGEDQPFQYFVSHTDPELVKAVQEGRRDEFKSFEWGDEVPDPQSEDTFMRSKLKWDFKDDVSKTIIFHYYKQLIHWRKQGLFSAFREQEIQAQEQEKLLMINTSGTSKRLMAILNYNHAERSLTIGQGKWKKLLSSSDEQWGGHINAPDSLEEGQLLSLPAASLLLYESI